MNMSTNDMPAGERATRLAKMILEELIADKPQFDLDALNERFKAACAEIGMEPHVVLTTVSRDWCERSPAFEERLRLRVKQVEGTALH
jgi:hypothetical protein